MARERITRRQKDIARVQREERGRIRDRWRSLTRRPAPPLPPNPLFSRRQVRELKERGISLAEAYRQYEMLKRGAYYVKLVRPCRVGDGILTIPEREYHNLLTLHDEAMAAGRMMKFVPASGAATRMFQDWYRVLAGEFKDEGVFLSELEKYPFYSLLKERITAHGLEIGNLSGRQVAEFILTERGLNYGNLPKALIPFHRYREEIRTALEEHLIEAAMYIVDMKGVCRLHFTTPPHQWDLMASFIDQIKGIYEKKCGVVYALTLSPQSPGTDTIALGEDGQVVKDKVGQILFRPGGHGALLKNLHELRGDLIFIKNIDNVVREENLPEVAFWHKLMGGFVVEREREIHGLLREIKSGKIKNAEEYVTEVLGLRIPREEGKKAEFLYTSLHRPVRVCGMVRNEGEPGGGPFWVETKEGEISLQIVEEAQVDLSSPKEMKKWREATHFNPVDLVCSLRDENGFNYRLFDFADESMALVTYKSEQGRTIRVVEHPGLWNGGMARWITFFIEIPTSIFNPVKTCTDLLRPTHQPKETNEKNPPSQTGNFP